MGTEVASLPTSRTSARAPDGQVIGYPQGGGQAIPRPGLTNLLVSAGAVPGPQVNALTGMPIAPPAAGTAQPPTSQQVAPAPPPAELKGQEFTNLIGRALAAKQMSAADLRGQIDRMEFVRTALGNLLKMPSITHEHCLDLVQSGVKAGVVPAKEAGTILGGMPDDPAKLRAELTHRRRVAVTALVQLHGEQRSRNAGAVS